MNMAKQGIKPGPNTVGCSKVHGAVFDSSGWLVDPDTTTVNVATIDFLARGGDGYDFGGAPFETLGITYEQAVLNYIDGPLGGVITQTQYPNVVGTRVIQDG